MKPSTSPELETDERRAADAEAESRGSCSSSITRFEQMVDHMRDGLVMLSADGDVLALNAAARDILKLSKEIRPHAALLRRVMGFDALEAFQSAGRSLRMEFWVDGSPFQAEITPAATGEETTKQGCVIAFRDVTEEKRIDEMKSELINVASHELRTPLTAIRNALDLLLGGRLGATTEKQAHFLELAKRNVRHLMEMVNDLLDSAKIESGKAQVEREALSVPALVASPCEVLSPQAEAKRIALRQDVDANVSIIYGKSSMLERVLINLIGNAIKFTPERGEVRISARTVTGASKYRSGQLVDIRVTDTGPGIPGDQLESVFERFHQVGRAQGQEVAGTGLGLAIARELVEAHHGKIWAENEPGGGARFVFQIPVLTEDEFFLQQLERELNRARRIPIPLALVVVQIANCKDLREQRGEDAYAEMLKALGRVSEATAYRSTDRTQVLAGRGETAATLLDTPREGAVVFARRLIEGLESEDVFAGAEFEWGCACFPLDEVTADRLYRRAHEPRGAETEEEASA
jgi:signal transduction histidine kinase/GGDEF domain-containing protein